MEHSIADKKPIELPVCLYFLKSYLFINKNKFLTENRESWPWFTDRLLGFYLLCFRPYFSCPFTGQQGKGEDHPVLPNTTVTSSQKLKP